MNDHTNNPRHAPQPGGGDIPTRDSNVALPHSLAPAMTAGTELGQYRLTKVLGRGGMGVVYLAEQRAPRREVALKLIRPDITDAELLHRLTYEADILARLQHPGIAQVFDAGTISTPAGEQPYFALEYIAGQTLTEHLRDQRVGLRERLTLFLKICEAVQHAHAKGVIHRDLKPANILVTADGQPKVLDFGVARVTGEAVAPTIQTTFGQLLGTLPYMSPEQVSGDPREVDTRSDVYALGVILYELLTGQLPHDFAQRPLPEAARIIREEPARPLHSANTALRGDLSLIVAHALEKERDRRYQSAADLAADIRRYLRHEPILARPPSSWYQLCKFARRRRALVTAAVAITLTVLGALGATSVALRRALDAEHRANDARTAEQQQRQRAEREAGITTAVNAFLDRMLASANPEEGDRNVTVHEVLDRATSEIAASFADQPVVEAAVRSTIGRSYLGLGEYQSALENFSRALELRRNALSADDPNTLASMNDTATALQYVGHLDEAEQLFNDALAAHHRVLGDMHPQTLLVENNLGMLLAYRGRYQDAEPHLRAALTGHRATVGDEDLTTLDAMSNLAALLQFLGRLDEAEPLARESLAIRRRVFGDKHPGTLVAMNNLGTLLALEDKLAQAEPLYIEGLNLSREVLGEDHPETLTSLSNLAGLLRDQKKLDDAERLYAEAVEKRRTFQGDAHPETLAAMTDLALTRRDLGQLSDAETLLREVLKTGLPALGAAAPEMLAANYALGTVLLRADRPADAAPYLRDAAQLAAESLGPAAWKTGLYRGTYGEALLAAGDTDAAETELRAAYDVLLETLGPANGHTRATARQLAKLYTARNDNSAAADWSARAGEEE